MEYEFMIHCKFSCWMCKSLPVYGSKIETEGPSAMLIIKELVHAATMHTDATLLRVRVGTDGRGTSESGTAFSHAAGLTAPWDTGSVFSCGVGTTDNDLNDNEPGEEDMTGRFACHWHLHLRVIIRTEFDHTVILQTAFTHPLAVGRD